MTYRGVRRAAGLARCGVPGRTKTYDIENVLDTLMQYCLLTYINQLMSITKIRFSAASVRGATHNA